MTAVLLIAGVVGFYYFEDESQLLRVLGMLGMAVVALRRGFLEPGRQRLRRDARVEVRKVVWPTRQETIKPRLRCCSWSSWSRSCCGCSTCFSAGASVMA